MNLLVLSPHRDDAAFSLSLSIASWLAARHRVMLLNVFTRSLYAPYSDADTVHDNDRLSYISAMRKKEDEAFLRRMPGLRMLDLNLKDAPIRLRCDSAAVCEMEMDPGDPAIAKIRKALTGQLGKQCVGWGLVCPLALGHHVDHRVVREAALPFTASCPSAFYEDLPYAMREGVRVDLSRFREDVDVRFHESLQPVLCREGRDAAVALKRRMCLLYASQIDGEMAESMARFSERYDGAERLWANADWVSSEATQSLSVSQVDGATPLPA